MIGIGINSTFFCNFAKYMDCRLGDHFHILNMASKRILFISQEINPYLPATDESTFGKELPHAFHSSGYEARIFMPRYGVINERRNQLHEVIRLSGVNIPIADADHPLIIKVASLPPARLQAYFIDNDDYFQKLDSDADPVGSNREDNDERMIFYVHGTIETARKLGWDPDVIVCTGWMGALAPLYLRRVFGDEPSFKKSKIISVFDRTTFSGVLPPAFITKLKAEGVKESDLKLLKGKDITLGVLQTLAVKHSHGVIINTPEPEPEVTEALASAKVKILPWEKAKEGISAFVEFVTALDPK